MMCQALLCNGIQTLRICLVCHSTYGYSILILYKSLNPGRKEGRF